MRGPRAAARALVGLALGALTAGVEMLLLVLSALLMAYSLAFSRGRRTVPAVVADAAHAATELERWRLRRFLGEGGAADHGPLKALAYLVLRVPVGLLGGVVLLLTAYGAAAAIRLAAGWWITGDHMDGIPPHWWIVLYTAVAGLVLLFLAVQGLVGVVALEKAVARRCLGPSPLEEYERRIAQLSVTRAPLRRRPGGGGRRGAAAPRRGTRRGE